MAMLPLLALDFFTWWFLDAPLKLFQKGFLFLRASEHQLSFFYIIKTFFKPWKGEYRDGLVTFAIAFGVVLKTVILLADIIILGILLITVMVGVTAWVAWPVATALLLLGFI